MPESNIVDQEFKTSQTSDTAGHSILYCYHPSLFPHLDFFTEDLKLKIEEWITTIYLERPNWVAAVRVPFDDLPSSDVVIKYFGNRSPIHRLLDPIIESRAMRAFRISAALQQAGVDTPQPLLAFECRHLGFIRQCYMITSLVPEATTARSFLKSHPSESSQVQALLLSIATATRCLHDAGIMHRDLTLGNFLLDPNFPTQVYLIDLSRAVSFRSLPLLLRLIDIARMNFGVYWPAFYRHYCDQRPTWLRYEALLYQFVRFRRASIALRKLKKRKGRSFD